jgi:hypothetical protein
MICLEANLWQQRADPQQEAQHSSGVSRLDDATRWDARPPSAASNARRPAIIAVALPVDLPSQCADRLHEHGGIIAERRSAHVALTRSQERRKQVTQRIVFRARQA